MLIIGDVHGKYSEYTNLIREHTQSIQVGDYGFDYSNVPFGHWIIGGNHDNYPKLKISERSLGDFGWCQRSQPLYHHPTNTLSFFFIRGAQSIDKHLRTEGVSWWPEEELGYSQLQDCVDYYAQTKPKIVLSHTCPKSVIPQLGGKSDWGSRTESAMDIMLSIHQPDLWIFGHFHTSRRFSVNNTIFICLNELETIEI